MNALPRTLEAFYDRMLQEIDDLNDQYYTHRAFLWLAFAACPVILEELAEAVVILPQSSQPMSLEEARLFKCTELLRTVPAGLISAVPASAKDEEVPWLDHYFGPREDGGQESSTTISGMIAQFSHFSVKEYLYSKQNSAGILAQYQLTSPMANSHILAICIAYLLVVGRSVETLDRNSFVDFPLLSYSANN